MTKYCNINIEKLIERVKKDFNSLENKHSINHFFNKNGKYIFLGTGSSYVISVFWAKIINQHIGCFTKAMLPRDFIYSNYTNIDKIIIFTYSGLTSDLNKATENISRNKNFVFTKGKNNEIESLYKIKKNNIISYNNDDLESGFINFEATVFPCIFLLSQINKNINLDFLAKIINKWEKYFEKLFKERNLTNFFKNTVNIFYGDMTSIAAIDIENKLVEAGICHCNMNEKKNFSHGRYVLYEKSKKKNNIYLKRKNVDSYEMKLLEYIKKSNTIYIESDYNDILCEFDLLIASMILIKYIGNLYNIDPSIATNEFSGDKLYKYQGDM